MLTKRQKEEFLKDGLSFERRQDLSRGKTGPEMSSRALDELLKFLKEVQEFSSPDFLLPEKPTTQKNKL